MKDKTFVAWILAALALSACAKSPLDGGTISNNTARFDGFAIEAGAGVRVQALLPTGPGDPDPTYPKATWDTLTPSNLEASTTPDEGSAPKFDRKLFKWTANVNVPEKYFKDGSVFLRAQELFNDNWVSMYSYDLVGLGCLTQRAVDAYSAGVPLDVAGTGAVCSRDANGKELHFVELSKPGLEPDLVPFHGLWLVPNIKPSDDQAALFPVPGGPPAELKCGVTSMNVAFGVKNQGNTVATQRSDRVSIPELGLQDIDVQPRRPKGSWDWPVGAGILFPPQKGLHATFDLTNTVANKVYTLSIDTNYDHMLPESNFDNNHAEVTFVRKCP